MGLGQTRLLVIAFAAGCGFDRAGHDAGVDVIDGSGQPDGEADGPAATRCSGPDPSTVALWTFDPSASLVDAVGAHPGVAVGGPIGAIAGPDGCGTAVAFPVMPPGAIVVADSPDFDLVEGSIDLWLTGMPQRPNVYGFLSRDAANQALPGHFTIYQLADGRLMARLQGNGDDLYLCSDAPLDAGRWYHVGINVGPPFAELWVDGVVATYSEMAPFVTGSIECGEHKPMSIAGNNNPLVIGAHEHGAVEGTGTPLQGYLAGGAVDHVRISSVRRTFPVP